jgi:hypothetical protein
MTPPLDNDTTCAGCFLYQQRGGRVCPMLDQQADEASSAVRRAVALRALILAEAPVAPSLIELVRQEARPQGPSDRLLLPPATPQPVYRERKEARVVVRDDPFQ